MRKSRGFNAPNRRIMLPRLCHTFLALISRPRRGRWCPYRTRRIDPHSLPCCSAARAPAWSQYWARAVQSYDRTRRRFQQTECESIQHYQGDLYSGYDIIWLFQMLTCWVTLASACGHCSVNAHWFQMRNTELCEPLVKRARIKFHLQLSIGYNGFQMSVTTFKKWRSGLFKLIAMKLFLFIYEIMN